MPERTVSSTKLTLGTIIASAKLRLFESATYGVDVLEVDMLAMDSDHVARRARRIVSNALQRRNLRRLFLGPNSRYLR